MDFADGTLVYLAKREFLSVILTVDHADFATALKESASSGCCRPITRNLNQSRAVQLDRACWREVRSSELPKRVTGKIKQRK
jgi:hypothetical protein